MSNRQLFLSMVIALQAASTFASEEADGSHLAQSQRNAESDGAAIATAVYCAVPKSSISLYAQALQRRSKEFSSKHNLNFSTDEYNEIARHSFNETMSFMNALNPTEGNKKENCTAINKKITAEISTSGSN